MKVFLSALCLLFAFAAAAQSDKYAGAMKKALADMDSAKTYADFQKVANTFERIGGAEKTQWLPYYYAGLSLTIPAWNDKSIDKDANASRVLAYCDKADAIEKNAETFTVRYMALTQQMLVDPQTRWAQYGQPATQALATAEQMEPNNPRVWYLKGQSAFGTPESFGGGKAKAKPLFEKALALFKDAHPQPLFPDWGQPQTEQMLVACQ